MAFYRHAQISYTILDRCFCNFRRLYTYDDLQVETNDVLYDLRTEGIKLRQLQYDIEHINSDVGWAIELDESLKKGLKKAFRYLDKIFTKSYYPLEHIVSIEQLTDNFNPGKINWLDYFDDIIGVTKPNSNHIQKLILKFSPQRIDWGLTKPLHGTQKLDKTDVESCTVNIEVVPNNELYQLLLSYGSDVLVISPPNVREEIKLRISQMNMLY